LETVGIVDSEKAKRCYIENVYQARGQLGCQWKTHARLQGIGQVVYGVGESL
jgi:hypothetical protein